MTQTIQLSALVQKILTARGYNTPAAVAAFLEPNYDQHLHDPFLLTDMRPAVERIVAAIKANESIAIYGDYDIDGLTATTLLLDFLGSFGAQVTPYIPDRFEEGYGINQAALAKLQRQGTSLVISVDCGITSAPETAWAKSHGLDLIITDHHAVPADIPDAIAVINPKRPGDKYPFKDLAGVGVAFKLAQALQRQLGRPATGQEKWLLDLVALGTVCDVVTLVGENRVLVSYGLKVLSKTRRVGLQALAEVATVRLADISSYHLGFMLGPRLNAAGRLEHATKALELLTTSDQGLAAVTATYLNKLNLERREQQAQILEQANQQAEAYANDPMLVLADPDWSHGIVGIVASKLMERWHKPVIVMQILDQTAKGSGRSVASFNLIEGLRSLDINFLRLGGHHFAAGFTIKTTDIDALRQQLNQLVGQIKTESVVAPSDLEVDSFGQLNLDLISELDRLEPFGNGNPQPVLAVNVAKVAKVGRVGADLKHLKLVLADKDGETLTALGFNMASFHPNLTPGQQVEAKFHLVRNDFFGQAQPELILTSLQ